MGRISDSQREDILSRVDLVSIIDRHVPLKKAGKNYQACCPFHDEKTPSFSVNPAKQFYYCFGCGAGGDAVNFLIEYSRMDFREAIDVLAKEAGVTIEPDENYVPPTPAQKAMPDALRFAQSFYSANLRKPEYAAFVDYVKGRGLSGETAQRFGLGAVGSGSALVGAAPAALQASLEEVGLANRNNDGNYLRDFFYNRLMFPIRNEKGRIVGFGGRVLDDSKPKYINSPESSVFDKSRVLYGLFEAAEANDNLERLIVVEGYMDVVALAEHGVTNAVAAMGANFSEHNAKLAYRYVDELVFCFDGDAAGEKAAKKAIEAVAPYMQLGKTARFAGLPKGEDPDSYINNKGLQYFAKAIDFAPALSQFLVELCGEHLSLNSPEGQAAYSKAFMAFYQLFPKGTYASALVKAASKYSGVSTSDFKALLSQNKSDASAQADSGGIRLTGTWKDELLYGNDGVKTNVANAALILEYDSRWKGVLAYDEFSCQIIKTRKPPFDDGDAGPWDDVDEIRLQIWFQKHYGLDFNSSRPVGDAARACAWRHRYHAVRDWLDRLQPWDGEERLSGFLHNVFGAPKNAYTEHVGQGWLVSAISRILEPGSKVDTMIILEGGQGQGKSSCIEELFTSDWYLESSESPGHKDFLINLQGNWGVEIGEMQSFSKADRALVKQIITRRTDKFRAPYDKFSKPHPRQCVFVGTVNDDSYLNDPTGARRFLPVACAGADVAYVKKWREQLWAEALELYQAGFKWWEFPIELAKREQDSRFVEDVYQEHIERFLRGAAPDAAYKDHFITGAITEISTGDLIKYACPHDTKASKLEQMRVSDVMKRLGWEKTTHPKTYHGIRTRYWVRPDGWEIMKADE